MSRRGLLATLDVELERVKRARAGKANPFGGSLPISTPELPDDPRQILRWEYEMCRVFISGHPLDYVDMSRYPDVVDVFTIKEQFGDGEHVSVLGIVEELSKKKTRRGNKPIAFFGVSDLFGMVNCMTFGKENVDELEQGRLIHARGVIETRWVTESDDPDEPAEEEKQLKVASVREVLW